MPRIKRYKLASKLTVVALGGATLTIGAGQLPALAYGPPPPPPPRTGYHNVVTSRVVGPAGAVIKADIDGLVIAVTIPPGEFSHPVQVTLLAPFLTGIGDAGHPGYRAIGGVGIEILVNGKPFTGTLAKPITVEISGRAVRPGDRVAVWNGKTWQFIGSAATGNTVEFTYRSAGDFVVLAPSGGPGRGGPGGGRPGRGQVRVRQFSRQRELNDMILESQFFAPSGASPAGIGVFSAQWLAARSN